MIDDFPMRKISLPILLSLLLMSCTEPQETLFFTEGNCEACGPLIERALEAVDGVKSATWDYGSSFTTVQYYPDEVSEETLQQALADAGFATGFYQPDTAARKALPACCQEPIDRKLQPAQPLPPGHGGEH